MRLPADASGSAARGAGQPAFERDGHTNTESGLQDDFDKLCGIDANIGPDSQDGQEDTDARSRLAPQQARDLRA